MYYLVTDENNKTWRDVEWGENVTHEETNPNFFFSVYDNAYTALFMYPAYEAFNKPKIWETSQQNVSASFFRLAFPKITSLKPIQLTLPTREQQLTFAIVCCINMIALPKFRTWAFNYLKGIDTSKESAHKLQSELESHLKNADLSPKEEYISCAHACLAAVLVDDSALFVANTAHRAFYDSPETERLDLGQIADICMQLSPDKIAEALAG